MPKPLSLSQQQQFDPAGYYSWFYDGSPFWNIVGGIAMVAVMLAGVMFPLWPVKLRIGVWYLSVGALGLVGLFIVIAIVRLILWCITKIAMAKAIWIFPNLFEDVGFVSRIGHRGARRGEARRKGRGEDYRVEEGRRACLEKRAEFSTNSPGRLIHPRMGVGRAQEEEATQGW